MNFNPNNVLAPAKGRLLISEPFLDDPHFKRTVILLCDHNENGTFGFVLNNYVNLKISSVIPEINSFKTKISVGGPVNKNSIFYLHTLGDAISGSEHVFENVYMGGDFNEIKERLNNGLLTPNDIRFFVGYSGWGKDQLSWELKEKSWIVSAAVSEQVMNTQNDNLWSQSLRAMGKDFAVLSNFPSDPNLN
jgi:putative transcriptional regulator